MTQQPFKISKINWVFAAIAATIILIVKIAGNGLGPEALGASIGSLFIVFLVSTLSSLFFWSILGKKPSVASNAFNITLSIMLIGSVIGVNRVSNSKKRSALNNIERAAADYRLSLRVNPDGSDSSYAVLANTLKKNMGVLAEESDGNEKEVYLLIQDFMGKTQTVATNWQKALATVQEERVLDFGLLNNQEEYDYQLGVVQEYIDRSNDYRLLVVNQVGYLKGKLKGIDLESEFVSSFMKGVIEKSEDQRPVLQPLIEGHIEYGETMKSVLKLLESEQGKWELQDMVRFENEKRIDEFNGLLDDLSRLEIEINDLYEELVKLL